MISVSTANKGVTGALFIDIENGVATFLAEGMCGRAGTGEM
jgi:hypothetical protein